MNNSYISNLLNPVDIMNNFYVSSQKDHKMPLEFLHQTLPEILYFFTNNNNLLRLKRIDRNSSENSSAFLEKPLPNLAGLPSCQYCAGVSNNDFQELFVEAFKTNLCTNLSFFRYSPSVRFIIYKSVNCNKNLIFFSKLALKKGYFF